MGDDRLVPRSEDVAAARRSYDEKTASLVGRRILDVAYWDVHNYGPAPRSWDFGDWHHAVMGVELVTDSGPVAVVWTDTFFPYGVEVFDAPMTEHVSLSAEGPEGWNVGTHDRWGSLMRSPVHAVSTFWETVEVGPATRSDGEVVSGETVYDVPVALRMDFADDTVWFVAGIPQWPDMDRVFVMGDEIMVVFSADRLRQIGFTAGSFSALSDGV